MTKEEAIEIAQQFIDAKSNRIIAKIEGEPQCLSEWVVDSYLNKVKHPVWVVFAKNLNTGPFIDGVSQYSIVVSTTTRQVEDYRLT